MQCECEHIVTRTIPSFQKILKISKRKTKNENNKVKSKVEKNEWINP